MKRPSSTKQQPKPTFFVDRDLGTGIVATLRKAGFDAEAHDDHFPQNTADISWIPKVAARKRVVLTNDKQQSRNALEIDAHMSAGSRVLLPKGQMLPAEFAQLIIRSEARILRYLKHNRKAGSEPFMAKLARDEKKPDGPGHVESWIGVEQWNEKKRKRRK